MNQADIDLYKRFQKSPTFFIQRTWGLIPQPLKAEYLDTDWTIQSLRADMFETFEKGKHLTWQQWQLLLSIEDAINGRAKKRIAIESGQGCHAIDTEVILFDGSVKKVQDVKIGDKLMGDDNTPREVLKLVRGFEQMYRVQYATGDYYDVNESHILSVVASDSHGKIKRGNIYDVSVKEFLRWSSRRQTHSMGYKKAIELPEKDLPIDPYLFGLWLGDGFSANGDISNPDREIIDQLFAMGANSKSVKTGKCPVTKVHGLSAKLKALGVKGSKHIPDIYLRSSLAQRRELLAGLLDSDGYLSDKGHIFEIMQKRVEIAKGILWLARSCGHRATLRKVSKTCTNSSRGRVTGDYYRVLISSKLWTIPTRVIRKQSHETGKEQRNDLHFCITVTPLEPADYYGFTVDGNHRYLLGDFTVTHNCGKTGLLAMVIIWFLFTHKDARIPCTAPTVEQMYDALWREVYLWLDRAPKGIKDLFEWTNDMLKVKERPETWFARARTARKERPEALAGIHGDHVLVIVDEASGVDDEVFRIAEGLLTGENVLFIMISQHQRLTGYFHRAFNEEKEYYQTLSFSSLESPIVSWTFVDRIRDAYGMDSDAWRVQVEGKAPREDAIDDKGYVPLLNEPEIRVINQDLPFIGRVKMGVDPSGEGSDTTEWNARDSLKAKCSASEKVSNSTSIASKTLGLMDVLRVEPHDVAIDNFGEGANVSMEIARAGRYVKPVNVGDSADDERFLNKRAELSWRAREWLKKGGELCGPHADELKAEALLIKYKYGTRGKIQIMSKEEMRKAGIKSPNKWDAFTLTFNTKDVPPVKRESSGLQEQMSKEDMYSAI